MTEAKQEPVLRYVFLDLETTGLDPRTDQILEIAAIITDANLVELGRVTRVVQQHIGSNSFPRVVYDMHKASGLLIDVLSPDAVTLKDAVGAVHELLNEHDADETARFILSGNTVHFDRAFLEYPRESASLAARFYHGHADVSSCRRVLGAKPLVAVDQVAHRALADCEMSLAEARALRAAFQERDRPATRSVRVGERYRYACSRDGRCTTIEGVTSDGLFFDEDGDLYDAAGRHRGHMYQINNPANPAYDLILESV